MQSFDPRLPDDRQPTMKVEGTKWSFALVGFYLSCAGVALGAAVGAAGFLWFESTPALVVGITMTLVSTITCFLSLRAARR